MTETDITIQALRAEIAELKQRSLPIGLGYKFRVPEYFNGKVRRMIDCRVTGIDLTEFGLLAQYIDDGGCTHAARWDRLQQMMGGSE